MTDNIIIVLPFFTKFSQIKSVYTLLTFIAAVITWYLVDLLDYKSVH